MKPLRLMQIVILLTVLWTSAFPILAELTRRRDIWWTPVTHPLALSEAKDRVQVIAGGKPIVTDSPDLRVRLDNFDRLRSERVPRLLWNAFFCGAALTLLTVYLMPRRWREQT